MSSEWHALVIDAADPGRLARFWAAALGYQVLEEKEDEVLVGRNESTFPSLVFGTVPEGKVVKNRLHIDLNPDDQAAEVERLEALGARRADIGQGDVSWVVMVDPEGNEFCVLAPHDHP